MMSEEKRLRFQAVLRKLSTYKISNMDVERMSGVSNVSILGWKHGTTKNPKDDALEKVEAALELLEASLDGDPETLDSQVQLYLHQFKSGAVPNKPTPAPKAPTTRQEQEEPEVVEPELQQAEDFTVVGFGVFIDSALVGKVKVSEEEAAAEAEKLQNALGEDYGVYVGELAVVNWIEAA